MAQAPNLLNDDGTASMATLFMSSHHAFRRDIARFASAVAKVATGDTARVDPLREEWGFYRGALHGHHTMEDTNIFPGLRSQEPALAQTIDQLTQDHHVIDPLLARGDRAFADLPATADEAVAVIAQLAALLDAHLAVEEEKVVPLLRNAREFPVPGSDAEAEQYAHGFSWSLQGLAPDVVEQILALLPGNLTSRLPAARAAFDARCERVWGAAAAGAARTPIPAR